MEVFDTLKGLYGLMQDTRLSAERMQDMQDAKLRKLLRFAWEHSTFYRRSFARAGIGALLGSVGGTLLGAFLTDPLVALLMRMEGISNFASHPGLLTALLPGLVVTALFLLFAYGSAGKIRKEPLVSLAEE